MVRLPGYRAAQDWFCRALTVRGGYCNGQRFAFNDGLNCLVGDNHSGKSAILDFIRFALAQEDVVAPESRKQLLARLYGILQPEGSVELMVRRNGGYYLIKRTLRVETRGSGADIDVIKCLEPPYVYHIDPSDELVPVENFDFPLEVYEQGRIGRLRDDLSRQLDMLDEFADLSPLKEERATIVLELTKSAEELKPLYQERDSLEASVANLPRLRQELLEKEKFLPKDQDQRKWSTADAVVRDIEKIICELSTCIASMPTQPRQHSTELGRLFGQAMPGDARTASRERC